MLWWLADDLTSVNLRLHVQLELSEGSVSCLEFKNPREGGYAQQDWTINRQEKKGDKAKGWERETEMERTAACRAVISCD